jgi:hypothetical protein
MIDLKFGTEFVPARDTAYLHIAVFNNYCYLAARTFSQDGNNFMVLPVSERNVSPNLSRKDTIKAIPAEMKHNASHDGLIIRSGCYPVSPEMEDEIRANIYVRENGEAENLDQDRVLERVYISCNTPAHSFRLDLDEKEEKHE